MNRRSQRRQGPGALDLIEEAVHLLRLSPGRVWGTYYLGSVPFVLALFYFWADLSRGPDAYDRCAPAAFAVGLLFLWMKTWQTIFASELKAQVTGRSARPLTIRRFLQVAGNQTVLQPSGLFLMPLALIVALPFAWVYAFYQSVTAFGADEETGVKSIFMKASRQAQIWPQQNHLLLGFLSLFGLVLFLDVAIGVVTVPSLLRTLLGIESAFTRSVWSFFNTTFLAVVCGVTYLCLDPLLKTVYVLRCFYGESLHTGEDLRVDLRQFATSGNPVRAAGLFFVGLFISQTLAAAPVAERQPATPATVEVSSADLDRAIQKVIQQREYSWRFPREPRAESEKGVFAAFMDGVFGTVNAWYKAVLRGVKNAVRWIADAIDWLREKIFGKRTGSRGETGTGWMTSLQILVFVLLALVSCTVAILAWRIWKRRTRRTEVASLPLAPLLDLADENVVADQLPEAEWLKLGRALMDRGELRLALRAFYLGSLAHLAQREMISIAKFKSNHDYEKELRRRARALPALQTAFGQNVTTFDRVWYGMHEVTADVLHHFQANQERIQSC